MLSYWFDDSVQPATGNADDSNSPITDDQPCSSPSQINSHVVSSSESAHKQSMFANPSNCV